MAAPEPTGPAAGPPPPARPPRVTVVTPVYNGARFLAEAIESVRAQTLDAWEHVIVDDGSTDASWPVALSYAAHDSRIRVLRQANGGVAKARNAALAAAHPASAYVATLDADDALAPAALETLCAYLDAHADVGVAGYQFTRVDADGAPIPGSRLRPQLEHRTRWVPGRFGIPRDLRPDERETPFVTFLTGSGQGPHAVFRRAVLERIGGWDEHFRGAWHEDTDVFCRMALAAPVHYLPDRLYRYRDHAQNSTKSTRAHADANAYLAAKWAAYTPDAAAQRETLEAARRYERDVYVPLRHLRTAAVAFADFVREPAERRWRFGVHNAKAGLRTLRVGAMLRAQPGSFGPGR